MADERSPDDGQQVPRPAGEEEESFLQRWSRRKAEAQAGARDVAPSDTGHEPDQGADDAPVSTPAARADEPPGDEDMPPLDTLDESSDYSGFLSRRVSVDLRRAALRKLFHGQKFNIRDGLDDYDGDFTRFAPLGDVVTADMRHRIEREIRERLLASDQDSPGDEPAAGDSAIDSAIDSAEVSDRDGTPDPAAPVAERRAGDDPGDERDV